MTEEQVKYATEYLVGVLKEDNTLTDKQEKKFGDVMRKTFLPKTDKNGIVVQPAKYEDVLKLGIDVGTASEVLSEVLKLAGVDDIPYIRLELAFRGKNVEVWRDGVMVQEMFDPS